MTGPNTAKHAALASLLDPGTWTLETLVELHTKWPVEVIPDPPPPPPRAAGRLAGHAPASQGHMPAADWVRYSADDADARADFSILIPERA